jgi:hypothetical protein
MKRKIKILWLLLGGASLIFPQIVPAQNLLVNSNFSTGNFSDWNVAETGSEGSPVDYGVTNGFDGGVKVPITGDTYGAYFNPRGGVMNLSQTVDVPANGTVDISCYLRPVINDQDTLTIFLAGSAVFTTNFEFGLPYTLINVSVPAVAGSQVVDFEFSPGDGPMFFDDAQVTASPAATLVSDRGTTLTLLGTTFAILMAANFKAKSGLIFAPLGRRKP